MSADNQRILTVGGGHNSITGRLEIESKQFKDMSLVVDGQNEFVCHVHLLFLLNSWKKL